MTTTSGRWARGVRNPRPEIVARVHAELDANPAANRKELAQRVGISTTTLAYYLRSMSEQVAAVSARHDDVRRRAVITHLDLVDRVASAGDDVQRIVDQLKTQPITPTLASACFKGYSTWERIQRLLAELLGEVSPPQQNVYIGRVEALLAEPIDPASLPLALRATVAQTRSSGEPP